MKQSTTNAFGGMGYCSLIVQWAWTAITIGLPIVTHERFKNLFLPYENPAPKPEAVSISMPEPVQFILVAISVLLSFGIIVYVLVAVPRSIAKQGKKITSTAAKKSLPHVTHHRHLTKKQQRNLLQKITWSIKFILSIAALLLLLIPPSENLGLEHRVVLAVGAIFAVCTVVMFTIQYLLARAWNIPRSQIV